jgi:hypothetical protein
MPYDIGDTTKEAWIANGISLNKYSWNITTFGDGRTLPIMRGNNIQVAYIPGQIYRPKYPDSRTITLNMWTCGIDPSTGHPAFNTHLQFSDNVQTLKNIFYNVGGAQFPLTRQWEYTLPVNTGVPMGVPTLVSATAMAEVAGNMQLTTQGPNADSGTFSIDLLLADPYFYGPPITEQVNLNTVTTVINTGDDIAAYQNNIVVLYGPLLYPRLTNTTPNPDTWIQLNTAIAGGDSVTFDVSNFIANRTSDGANLSGSITHSGTKRWMSYNPGVNQLSLSSSNTGDTGYASVSFQPPYA